jgi:hypothetical protein
MMSNEKLLIVLKRKINFDEDQRRQRSTKQLAPIDCLATSDVKFHDIYELV